MHKRVCFPLHFNICRLENPSSTAPEVVFSFDPLTTNDLVCFRYHRYDLTKPCMFAEADMPTICRAMLLQPADYAVQETRIVSDLLSVQVSPRHVLMVSLRAQVQNFRLRVRAR